jgi:hypothetical protein
LASNGARPVFEVAGRRYDWNDVAVAAQMWGEWQPLEAAARAGLACARRLETLGLVLADDDVEAAAKAFRTERRLFSADELSEWLRSRRVTTAEWLAWIRRSLLRSKWRGEVDDVAVEDEDVVAVLWIEGVCSGMLEAAARKLAGRVAAVTGAGIVANEATALEEAFDRFRQEETSSDRLEQEIERHRLDWVLIDADVLALQGEDVAREAALCVSDGMELDAVAAQAGVQAQRVRWYLDDVEPQLKPHLLSAVEGGFVGPVEVEGRFLLLRIDRKRIPTLGDADIRRRAEEAVLRRKVEHEVAQRVSWLERL